MVSLNSRLNLDFLPNQLLNKPPVSLSSANFNIVVGSCFIIELIADDLIGYKEISELILLQKLGLK